MVELTANEKFQIEPSAVKTSTFTSGPFKNDYDVGVRLFVDVTVVTGTTPTLIPKIQVKDFVSGNFVDLPGAVYGTINSVSTTLLTVYPAIAESANESVSDVLGREWQVVNTIGGGTPSYTMSIGGEYFR